AVSYYLDSYGRSAPAKKCFSPAYDSIGKHEIWFTPKRRPRKCDHRFAAKHHEKNKFDGSYGFMLHGCKCHSVHELPALRRFYCGQRSGSVFEAQRLEAGQRERTDLATLFRN